MTKKSTKRATLKALTPKQELFVAEYLANGFNATQAAIAAGYAKKNADTQGSRLLANTVVAAAIAWRWAVAAERRPLEHIAPPLGMDHPLP